MKRVKMMLLSLLVLGVVAGAMAFKAKFCHLYCTTPVRIVNGNSVCTAAVGVPLTCPNLTVAETIPLQPFNAWCTTTPDASLDCDPAPNCLVTVRSLKPNCGD